MRLDACPSKLRHRHHPGRLILRRPRLSTRCFVTQRAEIEVENEANPSELDLNEVCARGHTTEYMIQCVRWKAGEILCTVSVRREYAIDSSIVPGTIHDV